MPKIQKETRITRLKNIVRSAKAPRLGDRQVCIPTQKRENEKNEKAIVTSPTNRMGTGACLMLLFDIKTVWYPKLILSRTSEARRQRKLSAGHRRITKLWNNARILPYATENSMRQKEGIGFHYYEQTLLYWNGSKSLKIKTYNQQ
ncbi:MAG: hypothetical protein KAG53_04550 [Endozoicomonadaceae bacterium]|nr:hypothetical protein [Endozoicomonadaceae bacterium]